MYGTLAILAAFAFGYGIVAGRLEKTPVNGPVVFLTFGILVGPQVLGLLDLSVSGEGLRTVAELTLALVLFTDSANADLATLRRSFRIPQRLLLVGLPLTIAFGVGTGMLLFPDLPLLSVAILATMLAPTDAALGEAVVTNEAVPAPVREALNVESGLNDGICVPILFTFLALPPPRPARTGAQPRCRSHWGCIGRGDRHRGSALASGSVVAGRGADACALRPTRSWLDGLVDRGSSIVALAVAVLRAGTVRRGAVASSPASRADSSSVGS